jgi:predicted alpha/beta-fold hydrolase
LDVQSIWEFDETYTAPIHGFTSAEDYYRKCSGQAFIANIKIPTLILASLDDPIVETREVFKLPKQTGLDLVLTRHGGHLGFIGFDRWYNGYWWMDRVIINWVQHLMPTSQWLTQPNTGSARQLF